MDGKIKAWINFERETYTYDVNGKMLSDVEKYLQIYHAYEDLNGDLYQDANSKHIYSYDATGNMLTDLHLTWIDTTSVQNNERHSFSYDVNGNVLIDLREQWLNNIWENYTRCTYAYDANGNSISGKYEQWKHGKWESKNKDICGDAFYQNGILENNHREWCQFLKVYSQKNIIDTTLGGSYKAHWVKFENSKTGEGKQ